jgi:hypothetical protein
MFYRNVGKQSPSDAASYVKSLETSRELPFTDNNADMDYKVFWENRRLHFKYILNGTEY